MNNLLKINNLEKNFNEGKNKVCAVNNVSLDVDTSEILVIFGRSGSGKTTLLHLIAGLENASSGEIFFKGSLISNKSSDELSKLRRNNIGFVYQFHHLINEFTAIENASLPLILNGLSKREAWVEAESLLDKFGLGQRKNHRPSELSGGERQRVAICRALINNPSIVLLDEPTGDLDRETGKQVINQLKEFIIDSEASLIIATHDRNFEEMASKTLTMDSGSFL